ncbi:ribonuclease HII [Humibacter sp.]|uniref:ribonuclease HII n=1 Tax=Humibacter sp. TaxID=1940291 RepID=UPI002BE0A177|nr:ribonuclease HII [Humibacter sp.]HVX08203.1 ribonuclease HII [Humibacter sp.]
MAVKQVEVRAPAKPARRRKRQVVPNYKFETELHSAGNVTVIGCDEVGRGALAGPVAVGMVVVDAQVGRWPKGLRDSKLLLEPKREELAPLCMRWVRHHAVGLASAEEIDAYGIMACLGMAGARAFASLQQAGAPLTASTIILDGNYDYLSRALPVRMPVVPRIKADQSCASVAAASVIAKVHRDAIMIEQDAVIPGYSWASNKGYSSEAHFEAIGRLGPSPLHRLTWLKRWREEGVAQPELDLGMDLDLDAVDPELHGGMDAEGRGSSDPELGLGIDPELGLSDAAAEELLAAGEQRSLGDRSAESAA